MLNQQIISVNLTREGLKKKKLLFEPMDDHHIINLFCLASLPSYKHIQLAINRNKLVTHALTHHFFAK